MFINQYYVSVKINGEKDAGKELKKRYNIQGYPTVVFLKSNGEEIDRICGWNGDKEKYFVTIQEYTQGKNTLAFFQNQFDKNPNDIETNYRLAKKYISHWDIFSAYPYFQNILKLDTENKYSYHEEATGYSAGFELIQNKNDEAILKFLNTSSNEKLLSLGFKQLFRFYKREKNQQKLSEAYETAFIKFPKNTDYMNDYAWYIYENKSVDKYERGIELAKKAVELKPEKANIWDTLAWLEFEQGNVDRAIEIMKKCVNMDPEREYFQQNLEIFLKKKS
jgi:tetratricopeptide (TPR) repeat protein